MNGNVLNICTSRWGTKAYGFILGEDNKEYYFHKSYLINGSIERVQEGDAVEFTPAPSNRGQQKQQAHEVRIRPTISSKPMQYANPGVHRDVDMKQFNSDEQKIVQALANALYVTNGGREINVAGFNYRYILVKPTEDYVVNFNLQREIPVVFCDFESFEPRSLDIVTHIQKSISTPLRLDRSCQIIISRDNRTEKKLETILRDTNLSSVVVPFTYGEFISGTMTPDSILNRFRKYLFDADLFTTSEPIRNDVFFFGRRDYALDIATKCKRSSYLCGVFGLRRSGKTSMLYAIQRQLENTGCHVAYIPCQEQLENLDWQDALYQITEDVRQTLGLENKDIILHSAKKYRKANVSNIFTDDMQTMLQRCRTPVILMFDEIEAITFKIGKENSPWYDGESFIHFWNVLRGYCTRSNSKLSIVIAGTNPTINEVPTIGENKIANPMFQQLSSSNQGCYLQAFDIQSTKIMIDTLGGYMGIKFNESIPARLVEDCGGHPYLIRMLCGYIYKYVRNKGYQRPFTVSKGVYEAAREEFEKSNDAESFYLMILGILQSSYPKEYNTLKILAINGDAQLSRVLDSAQIAHLEGYGLVEKNEDRFSICYDAVKRFLQGKYVFERTGLTIEQQVTEIHTRMNAAEIRLRDLVRRTLNVYKRVIDPKQAILNAMAAHSSVTERQLQTAEGLTYRELFDPTVNRGCYFLVLVFAIEQNYDTVFSAVFNHNKEDVIRTLKERFNRYRQIPAHPIDENAKNWSNQDFEQFRSDMKWLEDILSENE